MSDLKAYVIRYVLLLVLVALLALHVSLAHAETQLVWSPTATDRNVGNWQCADDATRVLTGSSYNSSTITTFGALPATANVYQCRADRPIGAGVGCPDAGNYTQEGMQAKSLARLCVVQPPPPPPDPEPPPPPPDPPAPPPFTPTRAKCYLDRIDFRWRIGEGADALVWWCNMPEGIKRHYRAGEADKGTFGRLIDQLVYGTDDSLWALDRMMTDRKASDAEKTVMSALERQYGPRCYTRTSGTATTVPVYGRNADGTRGPRRTGSNGQPMSIAADTTVACGWRLVVTNPTDSNRYCYVQLLPTTTGQAAPLDSWALCRYAKAPDEGWPQ